MKKNLFIIIIGGLSCLFINCVPQVEISGQYVTYEEASLKGFVIQFLFMDKYNKQYDKIIPLSMDGHFKFNFQKHGTGPYKMAMNISTWQNKDNFKKGLLTNPYPSTYNKSYTIKDSDKKYIVDNIYIYDPIKLLKPHQNIYKINEDFVIEWENTIPNTDFFYVTIYKLINDHYPKLYVGVSKVLKNKLTIKEIESLSLRNGKLDYSEFKQKEMFLTKKNKLDEGKYEINIESYMFDDKNNKFVLKGEYSRDFVGDKYNFIIQ
jgi:hypothetical protein